MRFVQASFLFLLFCSPVAAQSPQPTKVLVNGIELHYVEQGSGEPLIFIHGGSGDYRSWESQMKLFSPHYRVISYSRRFNYPNQNPVQTKNHSALIEAEDLFGLINKLGIGRAHLVGTSYGAFTALVLALNHPEFVRSLVLAEPPAHQLVRDTPVGEAVYQEFMRNVMNAAAASFAAGDDKGAMKIMSDGVFGAGKWEQQTPDNVARVMQNALFFKAVTQSSDPFPDLPRSKLKQLRIPTLIITGETTTPIHRLVTAKLAQILPNAKAVTIPHAGHASNRDNPEAFNDAVQKFLSKHQN